MRANARVGASASSPRLRYFLGATPGAAHTLAVRGVPASFGWHPGLGRRGSRTRVPSALYGPYVTSIAVWAGVDSRGMASLYIASDSRISWGDTHRWDQGRKTFACQTQPYVFGYWGDVLFPALAIPAITQSLDGGVLIPDRARPFGVVGDALRRLWLNYPTAERRDVSVAVAYRSGSEMASRFWLAVFSFEAASDSWSTRYIDMPKRSSLLEVAGSGAAAIRSASKVWEASAESGTSRAVFGAFCDALSRGEDPKSGGGPQLVGLHREKFGQTFGINYKGQAFLAGAHLRSAQSGRVHWFNELFERVTPDGALLRGAKKHHGLSNFASSPSAAS